MFCASIPFQTMQNLPYDQLKDLSQNHENFSNSKPELQSRLCELLSNSQKNEPICLGPLLGPLMDRTVSEIVHAIACEAIKKGEELDQKTVLSVATGQTVSAANAGQRMAIAENISAFLLLESMEECVSQAKELQRWVEKDESRSKAAKTILSLLSDPSSPSLKLWYQGLTSLPKFVSKKGFRNVSHLHLSHNKLKKFPEVSAFEAVESLLVIDNKISTFPDRVEGIELIQELSLNRNQISELPIDLIAFQSLKRLALAQNRIPAIPERVSFPDCLEVLILEGNRITVIPENLKGLERLKRLYLANNQITVIPQNLKGLKGLEFLSLSANKISEIPERLEGLDNLKVFFISRNQLVYPPSLEELRARGLKSLKTLNT